MSKILLGQLSVTLVAASTIIYWRLMLRRRIKPHLFTWLIWGLAVGIAAAGRHVEHAGPGAWSMAAMSLSCLSVAALSLRYGEREITRGDLVALLACLAAIPLWYFTSNALVAIILVTAIDLGGYYPTVRKSWLRPHEEATYNFVLSNIVHGLSLAANEVHTLATMLTPSCILVANSSLIGMIWWRRARLAAGVLVLATGAALLATSAAQAADSSPAASGNGASYEFAAGKSTTVTVRLEKEGTGLAFAWPGRPGTGGDTVLLALRIEAGEGSKPSVEVATSSQRVRHYLDSGAHGVRWLNLSHLSPAPRPGDRVSLQPQGLSLDPQVAELRLFDNRIDLGQRILVIAPHPDDAEIAAFGLYADRHSTVVTVTAGNAGDANYAAEEPDPERQYELKGQLRAYDSVTVPWLGGVPPQRTANLGYFDARLDAMYRSPAQVVPELYGPNTDVARYRLYNQSSFVSGASRANSWQHLVEDLVAVLRQARPEIIVMPDPRLDSHHDHEFVAVALVQALDRWGGSPRFLLYTNHADENLYPDGPRGAPVSLPPLRAGISVQGVFSLATPPALQIRKLFALEAMHDLRPSPNEQIDCQCDPARWRPDYPRRPDVDYLRRGPRANELFLAYDSSGARAVIREFLAGYLD